MKFQILESAVKDAREKAEVIAATLGHKLGGIVSVDYTPDDIEAGDTVETVWYLE